MTTTLKKKIVQIVKEHTSNPKGITKTEVARIFTQRWGTSKSTTWDYIRDLIDSGEIELGMVSAAVLGA